MIKILQYFLIFFLIIIGFAKAEVGYSGTAEIDLFYRSNQDLDEKSGKFNGAFLQEAAIVLNIFGNNSLDHSFFREFKWKVAQKVATNYKFDGIGKREAWVGANTHFGEVRFGNQFSNYYLLQDWPYGTAGAGNTWAEYGVHSVWYAQGISYFSPTIEGFNINFQYNNGGYVPYKKSSTPEVYKEKSYAYASEITTSYTIKMLRFDVAMYLSQNTNNYNFEPSILDGFNNTKNRAQSYYGGFILDLNKVQVKVGYSYNKSILDSKNYTDLHKILVQAKYNLNDNNSITLGYQFMPNTLGKINGENFYNKNALHIVNAQYNHNLNNGVSLFLQVRQSIAPFIIPSNIPQLYMIDGKHSKAHSATRLLLGAWMAF